MKTLKALLLAVAMLVPPSFVGGVFVAGTITATGCKSRNLDPAGAYQSDKTLYTADKTIVEAYEVMDAFVKFEYSNRQALASTPEVGKAADEIRRNAQKWIKSAIGLRDAYAGSPTPDNRSKLDDAIRVLRQAITDAQRYISQGVKTKT